MRLLQISQTLIWALQGNKLLYTKSLPHIKDTSQ